MRCKYYFNSLLNQRSYSGKIEFDHKNERLSITVSQVFGLLLFLLLFYFLHCLEWVDRWIKRFLPPTLCQFRFIHLTKIGFKVKWKIMVSLLHISCMRMSFHVSTLLYKIIPLQEIETEYFFFNTSEQTENDKHFFQRHKCSLGHCLNLIVLYYPKS